MGKIIEKYALQQLLGEGVYAKVYKAVHTQTQQQVAIKVINADRFRQIPKLQELTVNQINTLSTMESSPHIIRYIDMLKTVNNFYFVYQYCNGGTLQKLIQRQGIIPEKKALIFFKQILSAFKVLNKHNIMHRDLKPDNILLHNGSIKLADFGFCRALENPNQLAQTMLGSPIFMAPEVLKGQVYNNKADLWSLGIVLYQLLFGKSPYESKSISKLIQQLQQDETLFIPIHPKISQSTERLLRKLIVKDYNLRIQWNLLFQYVITDKGEILPPKTRTNEQPEQFLRGSYKQPYNYQNGIYANQKYHSYRSPHVHSKINKSIDMGQIENENENMKKKVPQAKQHSEVRSPYYKHNLYDKDEKYSKLDIVIKTNAKCVQVSQLASQILHIKVENTQIFICYLLLKNIEKQIQSLYESLKKDKNENNIQIRQIIEQSFKTLQMNLNYFKQYICEQSINLKQIEYGKIKIIKQYIQNINIQKDEQLILATQTLDYLQDSILIKKNSYEKFSKEHLQRQIKQKLMKLK